MKNQKSFVMLTISLFLIIGFFGSVSAAISSIDLTDPDGGEYVKGSYPIKWNAVGSDGDRVNIYYDSGAGTVLIAPFQPFNAGSFLWNSSEANDGSNYKIIVASTDFGVMDFSGNKFTIDNSRPSVSKNIISSPNSSSIIKGGDQFTIKWDDSKISDINLDSNPITLEYSIDSGSTWTFIATNEINDGFFDWTTPLNDSSNVSIRITAEDKAGNINSSKSNLFTIDSMAPSIDSYEIDNEVISPNGDGVEDVINMTVNSDEKSHFNLRIKDSEGNIIRSWFNSGEDLSISRIWSGTYSNGTIVPDGTYSLEVEMTDIVGNTNIDNSKSITVESGTIYVGSGYATLQEAINAANAGDTVIITNGTYNPSGAININKQIKLMGESTNGVIITSSSPNYGIRVTSDNVHMEQFTLEDSGTYGLKLESSDNLTIRDLVVRGSGVSEVDLNKVTNSLIENIKANGENTDGFGLMILDSNDIVVKDITTTGNPWGGVSVHSVNANAQNIAFQGIFNASEDVPLLLEKDPPYAGEFVNVDIPEKFDYVTYTFREYDNVKDKYNNYSQWFYFETLDEAKNAAQSFVGSTEYDYLDTIIYDITEENYYVIEGMIIQDAINAANNEDTIDVYSGNYNETLLINKNNLTLKAADGENPVIKSADSGWIVGIRAENVTFEGFELIGDGANFGIQTQTLAKNATLKNNTISNVVTAIQTTTGVEIGENNILDNKISNTQVGISLQNNGNVVTGNDIIASEVIGIGSTKWPVVDNRVAYNKLITESGGMAVKVYNSSDGAGHVDGSKLNAEDNWWGTTNRTLIQGNISGNVDFTPWAYTSSLDTDSEAPVIDLNDTSVDEGSFVTLDASGSTDNAAGIVNYEWDLDNDSVYELSGKNMDNATFDASSINGTTIKTVNFRITDLAGNTANSSITVSVNNVIPTVNANSDISAATLNEVIQFSTIASDPGDSLTYSWDFGDGNVTSGQNLTHKYNSSGTYTVVLTVSDGEETNSTALNIKVNDLIWDLNSEWNLVSVPRELADSSVSVLGGATIYQYKNGNWLTSEDITNIESGYGYWVDNNGNQEVGFDYVEESAGGNIPVGDIDLELMVKGWNLIGLTTTNSTKKVQDVFRSPVTDEWVPGLFYVVSYDETSDEFNFMNSNSSISPGEGYWVYKTQ